MQKIIVSAISAWLAVFIACAGFGILYSHSIFQKYMPDEIVYEIDVDENIWPDRFFVADYTAPDFRAFKAEAYWTFEPGTSPLAGNHWVYHPFEISKTDVSYTVKPITG